VPLLPLSSPVAPLLAALVLQTALARYFRPHYHFESAFLGGIVTGSASGSWCS
jgi:hypothetical protein